MEQLDCALATISGTAPTARSDGGAGAHYPERSRLGSRGDTGGLADQMRQCTAELHALAERTGVVATLLRGHISESQYALYLRNLLPAYQVMEETLQRFGDRPELDGLVQPALYRAASIVSDLQGLVGCGWAAALPLLPSGANYAARVACASDGARLLAHCYTRSLGDLNGGQLIARRLAHLFRPAFKASAFTMFPKIADIRAFAATYRKHLNRAGDRLVDIAPVLNEAVVAFRLNIAISLEVEAYFAPDTAGG